MTKHFYASANNELSIEGVSLLQVTASAAPSNWLSKILARWLRYKITLVWIEMTKELMQAYLEKDNGH